jgi:hypothetical protein
LEIEAGQQKSENIFVYYNEVGIEFVELIKNVGPHEVDV